MSSCRTVLGTLACVVAMSACGSSSPSSTSPSGSSGGGEASKPPARILTDAVAALGNAGGYAMDGAFTENRQPARLKVLSQSSSVDLTLSVGGSTARMVALPSGAYFMANAGFWSSQGAGARAPVLADHWIKFPATHARAFASALGRLSPGTLSRCLGEDHGTLSTAGKTTVNGRSAILLKDAGNAPGTQPELIAVAAAGPPYPLRVTATGTGRPGGRIDVCNDGKGSDIRGTITLSRFGHVPTIRPPKNVQQAVPGVSAQLGGENGRTLALSAQEGEAAVSRATSA